MRIVFILISVAIKHYSLLIVRSSLIMILVKKHLHSINYCLVISIFHVFQVGLLEIFLVIDIYFNSLFTGEQQYAFLILFTMAFLAISSFWNMGKKRPPIRIKVVQAWLKLAICLRKILKLPFANEAVNCKLFFMIHWTPD